MNLPPEFQIRCARWQEEVSLERRGKKASETKFGDRRPLNSSRNPHPTANPIPASLNPTAVSSTVQQFCA
jgi:hypothetical protein